jgi:peroxiredoxin
MISKYYCSKKVAYISVNTTVGCKLKRDFMKLKLIFTVHFALCFYFSNAQPLDNKTLLDKINTAVNGVSQGEFILHDNYYKVSVGEDSSKRNKLYKCVFKILFSDSLVGYQLASFRDDGYEQVYDGNALLTLTPWDKTLQITDKEKHPSKIKELRSNYFIFPFFKYLNQNLQFFNKDTMINKVQILGFEEVKGEKCYKIQTGASQNSDKIKTEAYIFVSTKTFLPVRQLVKFENIIGQAKEIQTFDYWVSDFKAEVLPVHQFAKESFSNYKREKNFMPSQDENKTSLLPVSSNAPNWELPLLSGGTLNFSNLKGKIIVMDFWYKACAPCQKQMIALQKLHDQFEKNKVVFIGVNTIDDPEKDKLELFLKNRNITMPSVYNGRSIESKYGVSASPALFIIDKEGKILFTLDGYSDTLLEDVSKIIEQHL